MKRWPIVTKSPDLSGGDADTIFRAAIRQQAQHIRGGKGDTAFRGRKFRPGKMNEYGAALCRGWWVIVVTDHHDYIITVVLAPPGGTYLAGTEVTLTAFAAPGFTIDRWDGDVSRAAASVTVVMDSNKTVTGHFRRSLP